MARRKREPEPPRLLMVEGAVGVGKTAFIEAWSEACDARIVTLDGTSNPFLAEVFADPERRAFSSEMCFLLARHRLQSELRQGDLFTKSAVVDGSFARERIYAEALLSEAEQGLYERIYGLLSAQEVEPDLVVHLRAHPDALLTRLRARGHAHERALERSLMGRLCSAFSAWSESVTICPVITVDLTRVELEEDDDALERLVDEVRKASRDLGPGERYDAILSPSP